MIYVHVPFCRSFCIYCGFYSELAGKVQCGKTEAERYDEYVREVVAETRRRKDEILASSDLGSGYADTLYIGGGTPSVLPENSLFRIIDEIKGLFPAGHQFQEFTLEVNPEDIVERGVDYVRALMDKGVDRISMGIQSFDDHILKWMNRRHDAERAEKAFGILRNAGMRNIRIDLIFGIPFLDSDTWHRTLEKAVALHPEHISAYQLSIDDNSALGTLAREGKFEEAPEEECRNQYDYLCERLSAAGFHHYEISNFALPGKEARHNSAYWKRIPYVGLGPGAHSLKSDGLRTANTEEMPYSVVSDCLTGEDIKVETIMLGLRTDIGVKKSYIYSHADPKIVDACLASGQLVPQGDCFRIPENRFFVSDQIICGLI